MLLSIEPITIFLFQLLIIISDNIYINLISLPKPLLLSNNKIFNLKVSLICMENYMH